MNVNQQSRDKKFTLMREQWAERSEQGWLAARELQCNR